MKKPSSEIYKISAEMPRELMRDINQIQFDKDMSLKEVLIEALEDFRKKHLRTK